MTEYTELITRLAGISPVTVTPVRGGFRNHVYVVAAANGTSLVLKQHRPAKPGRPDFYHNELTGYQVLHEHGCRLPQVHFQCPVRRVIGLERIPGNGLTEGLPTPAYYPSIDLLLSTQERTRTVVPPQGSVYRSPTDVADGIQLIERHAGLAASPQLRSYVGGVIDRLEHAPTATVIGSFIPPNVVRATADYHIDLEMFGRGNPGSDIAYFALYAGASVLRLLEHYQTHGGRADFALIADNMAHLGILTLGIYARDLANPEFPHRAHTVRRIRNMVKALQEIEIPALRELVAVEERLCQA